MQDHPWRRRLVGLGLGLAILFAFEGLCRFAGLGRPDPNIDPYVSFSGSARLFTTDPLTNTHVTAPERLKYFVEDRFPRLKSAETFRIFCLGGSTVQGRPYSIETAFPTWLRLRLELAYPDRKFDVINCGGVSYASYRLIPILKECLQYEPDLFIICTGQNEFLEDRTYHAIKPWSRAHALAAHSRLYHLLRQSLPNSSSERSAASESRPILKEEVDALLDYQGGLRAYQRNDQWIAGVETHFSENVHRLIALAKSEDVPVLFLRPPVNLKSCPPFKSDPVPPEAAPLLQQAQALYQSDLGQAIDLLTRAIALAPRCAYLQYELAQCHLGQANYRAAEQGLWRALEEDLCPLRLRPVMAKQLREICQSKGITHIDIQDLLGKKCPQGLMGQEILVDHVHPSIRGHQLIAAAIEPHLQVYLGSAREVEELEPKSQRAFANHLAGLDELYYTHGQTRLRNLELWTQGRTDGPPFRGQHPVGTGADVEP